VVEPQTAPTAVDIRPLRHAASVVAEGVVLTPMDVLPDRVVGVDAAYLDPSADAGTSTGTDTSTDTSSGREVAWPISLRLGATVVASAVVLDSTTMEIVEQVCVVGRSPVEYQPGRLAFREAPAVLAAIGQLHDPPQLVICDGHGLAHPQRAGLACHVGYELGVPTIGCAKNRLTGTHGPLDQPRGSFEYLEQAGETVGVVLRTQSGVKPVFVSPGHLIDVNSAMRHVLALTPTYRLPETTRAADQLARQGAAVVGGAG